MPLAQSQWRDAQPALSATAPAKINLTLRVTGRRADGYHLLDSLVVFANAGDLLSVRPIGKDDAGTSITVDGPFAGQLSGEPDNLILRATRRLAESQENAGTSAPLAAAFTLTKNLPVASGIGGGSADAAAALHLLNRLWGLGKSLAELQALALPLGADIPVCLLSRPAVMRGIGEEIAPLDKLPPFAMVLANPGVTVSTGAIFKERAEQGCGYAAVEELREPFAGFESLIDWLAQSGNDLEAPALKICPSIGEVLDALGRTKGCRLARMSGSGATCFGLYAHRNAADSAAEVLKRAYPGWWIVACDPLETTEPY